MLGWPASRVAGVIAFLLVLTSVLAFFGFQNLSYQASLQQQVADNIASAVNTLAGAGGEATVLVTFDPNQAGAGILLPSSIGGDPYTLQFTSSSVLILRGGNAMAARFVVPLHLWNPGELNRTTADELARADRMVPKWEIPSSTEFSLRARKVEGLGTAVFAYKVEWTEALQAALDSLGNKIHETVLGAGELLATGKDVNRTVNLTVGKPIDRLQAYPGILIAEGGKGRGVRFEAVDFLGRPNRTYATTERQLQDHSRENPGPLTFLTTKQVHIERRHMLLLDHRVPDTDPLQYEQVVRIYLY